MNGKLFIKSVYEPGVAANLSVKNTCLQHPPGQMCALNVLEA
jgi:hypothetical protein